VIANPGQTETQRKQPVQPRVHPVKSAAEIEYLGVDLDEMPRANAGARVTGDFLGAMQHWENALV